MIKGLNHIGISVIDIGRSVEFYRDVLHMQLVVEPMEFSGALYERILALDGSKGRVALLRAPNMELELFEFHRPTPQLKDSRYPVSAHGISHFCVEVADIESIYKRLISAGVHFHCEPMEFYGAAIATYARDPDGNVFELLELKSP